MLTQQEFDDIRNQQKKFETNEVIVLGPHPIKWSRTLKSIVTRDTFVFDFSRNSAIKVSKYSCNKRYHGSIVIFRYCSDKPHTNPPEKGGAHFPSAHIHIYEEGFDDKVAHDPLEIGIEPGFTMAQVMGKIFDYLNIINAPQIQTDLF